MVAPHLVLTAAHVVAGATESRVVDAAGEHRAIPVVVDPLSDVAVLYVEAISDPTIAISDHAADRGTLGVLLGYPNGGALQATPTVVLANERAESHDIYGQRSTVRQILEVQALILPGSSGGPLVDSQGRLIGMVFGESQDDPGIGYTLTSGEIRHAVDEGLGAVATGPTAVGTGPCLPPHPQS